MKINLDILKSHVSTLDVAKHLGMPIEEYNGKIHSVCPRKHSSKSGKSFVIEENGFRCWSCGIYGSAITLYMEFTGQEFKEAIKNMAQTMCPNAIEKNEVPTWTENLTKLYTEIQEHFQKHSETVKNGLEKLVKNRGFDDNVIEKYGIGYSKNTLEVDMKKDISPTGLVKNNKYFTSKRLTIPIKLYGEIIGFTMRKIKDDDDSPKYYNISKTPFEKWLWNFNFKMKEVVICEGVFDAMTVQEYGHDAVATLGTSISKERIQNVLKKVKKVYLMFDNDDAGKTAVERFFFNNTLNIEGYVCELKNKDPDECSKEEIDTSIVNAVEIKEWLVQQKTDLVKKKEFLRRCMKDLDSLTSTHMERLLVAEIKKEQVEIILERASFLKPFFELKYENNYIFTGTFNECNRFEHEYKKANPKIKDYSLFSRIESTQDRLDVIEKKILSAVNNLLNGEVNKTSELEINNMNEGV